MRILLNIVQLSLSSVRSTGVLRTTTPLRPTISYRYKWTSRTPTAILNEEEVFDTTETTVTQRSKRHKRFKARNENHKKQEEKKIIKGKDKHLKEEGENEAAEADKATTAKQKYTSLKGDEKLIRSVMIDVRTKQKREKSKLMVLEGVRLIQDAVLANLTPKMIFFSRTSDVKKLSLPEEVQVYKIPYSTIQLWSALTTSPGIMGIFEIPNTADKEPSTDSIPLTIICDNIREPGNLGTIVRAAAAVGCEKLLLIKGCADLWDSKVLRSAMGAHFRIPIMTSISWDEIPTIINEESAIFLADNRTTYEDEFNDEGIVDDSEFDESNKDENNAINQVIDKVKQRTAKMRSLVKKLTSQLPVEPYHKLQFTQKEAVLVVGGETEGVSLESCKLLRARNCIRVHVPLTNDIDSLNVGVAVGIITFEMKRQFIMRKIEEKLE